MQNKIVELLKFANLQMAAESFLQPRPNYLSGGGDHLDASDPTSFRIMLGEGNTHSSRFSAAQAIEFSQDWDVVAHKANAPLVAGGTGFSGTLFRAKRDVPERGIKFGELVIAFRSTEFLDDNIRDSKATNELELKDLGWGFGQIAEMRDWYRSLKRSDYGPPIIASSATFSVLGYSLGGHLATAFNLLLAESGEGSRISQTFTFNGAGTGGLKDGATLTSVIDRFVELRESVKISIQSLPWDSSQGAALAIQVAALTWSSDTNSPWARLQAQLTASVTSQLLTGGYRNDVRLLESAMSRVGKIFAEEKRVAELTGNNYAGGPNVRPPAGEQASVTYQLAALFAAKATTPSSVPGALPGFGGVNNIPTKPKFVPVGQQLSSMTEIYGNDAGTGGWSFVTNSGLHYGLESKRVGVYIEDQPLYRGKFSLADVVTAQLLQSDAKNNDFGDTHSLVLIVDSLAVGAALSALDPTMSVSRMDAIYKAAGNKKKESTKGTQGKAEGDTIEAVLDGLRRLFMNASGVETTPSSLVGGTWSDISQRDTFHSNLDTLKKSPAFAQAVGKLKISTGIASAAQARSNFTDFMTLYNLTPFRAVLTDPNDSATASAIEKANANLAALWKADGTLNAAQRASGEAQFSDAWLQDRSAMLGWIAIGNTNNLPYDTSGKLITKDATGTARFEDRTSNLAFTVSKDGQDETKPGVRRITFGSALNETLIGADAADRLYGAGGDDILLGKQGNDYFEGGIGADTYFYKAGDGADTVAELNASGD